MQPTALRRTKRAPVSRRTVLLPLLAAAALIVSAVAAQATQAQAAARHQLSALTGLRPSLVPQRHAGEPFAPDRRRSNVFPQTPMIRAGCGRNALLLRRPNRRGES